MTEVNCPNEKTLNAWIRREIRSEQQFRITDHVDACEACRQRVEGLRLFEAALAASLVCPSDEALALHIEGRLREPELGRLLSHLEGCADCADSFSISSEGFAAYESGGLEAEVKPKQKARRTGSARRTRRRTGRKKEGTPFLIYFAPVAAAAALLLLFALSSGKPHTDQGELAKRPDRQNPIRNPQAKPNRVNSSAPKIDTSAPGKPGPHSTGSEPSPAAPTPLRATPKAVPAVQRKSPEAAPEASPSGNSGGTLETGESRPEAPPEPMQLARAGGRLAVRRGGAIRWTHLDGAATLLPSDRLMARGGHGFFDFGGARVTLRKGSEAHLGALDAAEARIHLDSGEALFDLGKNRPKGQRFRVMAGEVEATALGTRFLLQRLRSDTVLLVTRGRVSFQSPKGKVEVAGPQAFRASAGSAPSATAAAKLDLAWLDAARRQRLDAEGLNYPLAFLARRALTQLAPELSATHPARQARALHALRALQVSPETANAVSPAEAQLADKLEAALCALEASRLVDESAAADLLQSLVARAYRELKAQRNKNALKRCAKQLPELHASASKLAQALVTKLEALLKAPGAPRLLGSVEALIALRESAALGISGLSSASWKKLATRLLTKSASPSAIELLGLALLPRSAQRRGAIPGRLARGKAEFRARFLDDSEELLSLQRAAVLLGETDKDPCQPVLLRRLVPAAEATTPPEPATRALFLARSFERIQRGTPRKVCERGPRVLPLSDGRYLVRFTVRPESAKAPVMLCGDWDDWSETATPMRRSSDGRSIVERVLPKGRHLYKFKTGPAKDAWSVDRGHPLRESDGFGGENSVLDLR